MWSTCRSTIVLWFVNKITCGLCLGEDPGEELSSVLEPGLPMLRSLFSLRKLPPDPDLVTIPEPFSASSSACLSLGQKLLLLKWFYNKYLLLVHLNIYLWISCLCEMIMFSLSCKTWLRRTCSLFRLPGIQMNLIEMQRLGIMGGGRKVVLLILNLPNNKITWHWPCRWSSCCQMADNFMSHSWRIWNNIMAK